jgi:molybdopterin/thiamine biosynthesis adenylyltransferase
MTLARMGIGHFHMADRDQFSLANFNRQYGATISALDKNKAEVMAAAVREVNPEIDLKIWNEFIDESNVETFLSGCDLVLDGIDAFNIEARLTLFMKAREMGIPVITAGPIGFSCALLIFTPTSMSFEDYFNIQKGMNSEEQFVRFITGMTPLPYYLSYMNTKKVEQKEKHGPCAASAIMLCAGFAATEAVKILLKRGKSHPAPHYHYFDPYLMKFKRKYLFLGNRNPIQRLKISLAKKFILK